ncbi:MAG: sigma 54-interacting transcriptional regulator [Proteobacteria bacterium]|nr:sigma 54-interacting transcriptional regulator [Pseudomonadota bacterium]
MSDDFRDLDNLTVSIDEHGRSIHTVRGFRLEVVEGKDCGTKWESKSDRATIGAHPSCDLIVSDDTVSRFHCEIVIDDNGAKVRDLGSRNGTIVDGLHINDAYLKHHSVLQLGHSQVRFQYISQQNHIALSHRTGFGDLVGQSIAMRTMFAMLERAAGTNITILLQGETGTGKSETARSIHRESSRRDGPFVMLDCGAIPANLLESELFGQEKGAFTGATSRKGSFEEAHGGTIFLDEIGELPLDLQNKLLSVIENREVRRLGSNVRHRIDVRIIAATNRDLRGEVNHKRFREDLYYRLAVVTIDVPPLRLRPGDLPHLARRLLARMGVSSERIESITTPEFLQSLRTSAWPGNIRELRNFLERYLVFQDLTVLDTRDLHVADTGDSKCQITVDCSLPFSEARQAVLNAFERIYVSKLLAAYGGKVSRAASEAGIDRTYIYKLLQRHELDK